MRLVLPRGTPQMFLRAVVRCLQQRKQVEKLKTRYKLPGTKPKQIHNRILGVLVVLYRHLMRRCVARFFAGYIFSYPLYTKCGFSTNVYCIYNTVTLTEVCVGSLLTLQPEDL